MIDEQNARLLSFLNLLAGSDRGTVVLGQLTDSGDSPEQIARELARSPAFEYLYKDERTKTPRDPARQEADFTLVGLPAPDPAQSFQDRFEREFAPRLGKRADGFHVIFDHLGKISSPLIVETGCMRTPGNWEGDGQSSFLFDAFIQENTGRFFSIDIGLESIDTARRACSSATQLILNDSVSALHALAGGALSPASLLYLDSYDFDIANPMPSAIHHALELIAAGPLVGRDTIVCVDDYAVGGEGGKGMIIDQYFSSVRAEVLYSGYQKIWRAHA